MLIPWRVVLNDVIWLQSCFCAIYHTSLTWSKAFSLGRTPLLNHQEKVTSAEVAINCPIDIFPAQKKHINPLPEGYEETARNTCTRRPFPTLGRFRHSSPEPCRDWKAQVAENGGIYSYHTCCLLPCHSSTNWNNALQIHYKHGNLLKCSCVLFELNANRRPRLSGDHTRLMPLWKGFQHFLRPGLTIGLVNSHKNIIRYRNHQKPTFEETRRTLLNEMKCKKPKVRRFSIWEFY